MQDALAVNESCRKRLYYIWMNFDHRSILSVILYHCCFSFWLNDDSQPALWNSLVSKTASSRPFSLSHWLAGLLSIFLLPGIVYFPTVCQVFLNSTFARFLLLNQHTFYLVCRLFAFCPLRSSWLCFVFCVSENFHRLIKFMHSGFFTLTRRRTSWSSW